MREPWRLSCLSDDAGNSDVEMKQLLQLQLIMEISMRVTTGKEMMEMMVGIM